LPPRFASTARAVKPARRRRSGHRQPPSAAGRARLTPAVRIARRAGDIAGVTKTPLARALIG